MSKGAIYVNDGTPVTGSFSKIVITGGAADVANHAALFDDIQFGLGSVSNDDGTNGPNSPCHIYNVVTNMQYTGSAPIEGPICGFHLTNGEVLAYYS